jgi:hypothetical protein
MVRLVLWLALLCSACGAPQLSVSPGGSRAWPEPGFESLYGTGYGGSALHGPRVACDGFGHCWQVGPHRRFTRGHVERPEAPPPGWAADLPGSARSDRRFVRAGSDVVCDRATRICYNGGKVDRSDTERVFGGRAGDRADALRDRLGSARVFVPERGVACDRERRACLEDGEPDRSLTRRYFGRRAARGLDDDPPRARDGRSDKRRNDRKEG